jgi:predicted HicB family RNase H-like nuclease
MTYKGYQGVVEYDEHAKVFTGEVINTRDVITFEGRSVRELEQAFHDSVDDYPEFCKSRDEEPDKPFSGKLMVRMPPARHRRIALEARRKRKSVNRYITERLKPKAVNTGE